jgi:predicted nucleic acid-binding protein
VARLILTDASPVIALDQVEGLGWLRSLFGSVEMTRSVYREIAGDRGPEARIAAAIGEGWLIARRDDPEGPAPPPHLGAGEWSTILAARESSGPCLALIDDRLARREAQAAGIRLAGTAAVIGMARARGLVPSARGVFERLLRADFRIAPGVIREVLERVEPGGTG